MSRSPCWVSRSEYLKTLSAILGTRSQETAWRYCTAVHGAIVFHKPFEINRKAVQPSISTQWKIFASRSPGWVSRSEYLITLSAILGTRSQEAVWPSGQRVGQAIPRSRVRVPLWPVAGSVVSGPELKSSATPVGVFNPVFELFVYKYLSGVPVK